MCEFSLCNFWRLVSDTFIQELVFGHHLFDVIALKVGQLMAHVLDLALERVCLDRLLQSTMGGTWHCLSNMASICGYFMRAPTDERGTLTSTYMYTRLRTERCLVKSSSTTLTGLGIKAEKTERYETNGNS